MINKIIIICVIIFIVIKFRIKSHKFWDKQPVSRNNIKTEGIIGINPKFNIILDEKYVFKKLYNDINLCNFINTHFSKNYKYSSKYLQNYLFKINSLNIGLFYNNLLIGFIHSKPVELIINNKIIKSIYVDFLCLHKNFRNKNLAPCLISYIINSYGKKQTFIFKKDKKKLPFNYLCKTSYYYFNIFLMKLKFINKIYFNFLCKKNLHKVYKFIFNSSKKHSFYRIIKIDELNDILKNNSKKLLIEYDDNNNIKAVIIFIVIKFVKKITYKTIDIESIYIDNKYNNFKIFDYLINWGKKINCNLITCIDTCYNSYFINKYNMLKSFDLYYHMYNYNLKKINKFNFCFNFL